MAFTKFTVLKVAAQLPLLAALWLAYGAYQDYSALQEEVVAKEQAVLKVRQDLREKEAQLTALRVAAREMEMSNTEADVVLARTRDPKWKAALNKYLQMQEDVRGFCEDLLNPTSDLAKDVDDSLSRPESTDPLDHYLHLQHESRGFCEDLLNPESKLAKAVENGHPSYSHIRPAGGR